MARPKKITMTGTGVGVTNSAPFLTNWREPDAAISLGLKTSGSTTTAKVQHMFDDPSLVPAADWTWFDHPDLTGLTAGADGNYAFPVTGIRLQLGASGTDTWSLFIVQSGG